MIAFITININPVLAHLGPFTLRWYSLIMVVAALVGAWIFARQLERRGISRDHVLWIAVPGVPSAIIFARLFHVVDGANFDYYSHHLLAIVKPPYVGLAIYGVLTGAFIAVVGYCYVRKLPTLRVLDSLALALPVGQIIGRFANIINGDTWGPATKLSWGFVYRNPHALLPASLLGVPTQPTPVYEQLWLIVMIAVMLVVIPRLKTDGIAILLYVGLYSLGRFFISFARVNDIVFLGLREAQIVALIALVLVFPIGWWLRRRARAHSGAPGGLSPAQK
jgi:prolipoprotein diacylglyceryl transferase